MKMFSRLVLSAWLGLLLFGTACSLPAQTPVVPTVTISATSENTSTPAPTVTVTNETPAVFIPITGMDVVSLQCQFCVKEEAHAVLLMSSQVFFNVSDSNTGVTCLSAQEQNGRRILLCRGAQQTSFDLNVCVANDNCLQFPITLQACPLSGTGTPTTLTPAPLLLTPLPASSTRGPRNTPVPGTVPTTETPAPQPTENTVVPSTEPTVITTPPSPESTPIPELSSPTESIDIGKSIQAPAS
jgi:hypothetical protein